MAEKKIEEIRDALRVISDIQNMDETNPIVHRVSNATVRKVTTTVAAVREPTNLIVPLNVIWFDFNPQSKYYKAARRRLSKNADPSAGTLHTWEVIDTYAQFIEDQFYDAEDAAILNTQAPLPVASPTVLGIAKLSVAAANGAVPTVVGEGDPRLTDARQPTEHTHAEKPATQLKTRTGVVTIENSAQPVVGATLFATSPTTAVWRQVTNADVNQ